MDAMTLMERIVEWYPNEMVLKEMNEWDRAKLAGKVELISEIMEFLNNDAE